MCILELKYFVLIFIGIGIIDLIHDGLKMVPLRMRVPDIGLDNAHT